MKTTNKAWTALDEARRATHEAARASSEAHEAYYCLTVLPLIGETADEADIVAARRTYHAAVDTLESCRAAEDAARRKHTC